MASDSPAPAGLSELYQAHHTWLVRWLSRRTQGDDRAQDLAQDTFMRLLERPLPEGLRNPRAWLAKMADNLLIDQARRRTLERNYLEHLASLPEHTQPSPEQQWELLQLLDQIDALLDGLRPIEKKAFLMARLDGMRYQAIADALQVSLSSVEKYMAKAMLKCYTAAYPDLADD